MHTIILLQKSTTFLLWHFYYHNLNTSSNTNAFQLLYSLFCISYFIRVKIYKNFQAKREIPSPGESDVRNIILT